MSTKTIYKCDKCGKEWEYEIKNGVSNPPVHISWDRLKKYDLCKECATNFMAFVKCFENECEDY